MPPIRNLFALLFFALLVVSPAATHAQKSGGAAAATTAAELLSLLDRAISESGRAPRVREALQGMREEAAALQQLVDQLTLRREIAQRARQEAERERQQLLAAPLAELTREFRERERSDPNAAAEWSRAQESALLEARARWQAEREQAERRPASDPPALLNRPAEPASATSADPTLATIWPLLRLKREEAQRLWQEVLQEEEAARLARRQLAEAHLTRIDRQLAQIAKFRPASAANERWQQDPLGQQIQALIETLNDARLATQSAITQLQETQRTLDAELQRLTQSAQRLTQRRTTAGLTPLQGYQLTDMQKALQALKEASTSALRQASDALGRWQKSEILLVQSERRLEHINREIDRKIAGLDPEAQPEAKRALNGLLEEARGEWNRLTAQRQLVLQAAADLETVATSASTFADQILPKVHGQLLWAQSAPVWGEAVASEGAAIATAITALIAALPSLTDRLSLSAFWWAILPLLLLVIYGQFRTPIRQRYAALLPATAPQAPQALLATLKILVVAALSTLGTPLALVAAGLLLAAAIHPYLAAAGIALLQTAFLWWNLRFWTVLLTYEGGLLHHRYNRPSATVHRLARRLRLFVAITAPLATLTAFLMALPAHEEATIAVRTALLAGSAWLALFMGWLWRPWQTDPLLAGLPIRYRWLLWVLATLPPLACTLLLFLGYRHLGEAVLLAYWRTVWTLLIVMLAYDLIQAAITTRWDRLIAKRMPGAGEPSDGQTKTPETPTESTKSHDIVQLLRLVRWGLWLVLALLLVWLWGPLLPALGKLDEWVLWRYQEVTGSETLTFTVSVADLLFALVTLALLTLLTRHAPLLLEFALARAKGIDAGTQYAAVTLFRYLLVSIGLVWILNRLGMPWSKLQWMVAALSVGLGFGLQEIVANFVSGLIILFEQPIRVGDLVTIQGTTGRVKRITIRATVIETPDKQEVLIPNKAIITGSVTNWTLSDQQSRLVLTVGVAYGTDLETVCHRLLAVAQSHPNVLAEPEPSVAFVQFGPSSIDLELRCFVADIAVRNQTRTELAIAITRDFAETGIEIPFPQQDLHLRTIAPAAAAVLRGG